MAKKTDASKEAMAKFLGTPTREGLRDLIRNNFGEFSHTDFKEKWPDLPKVARHVLGLANSGGGVLIIGVAEKPDKSVEPVGLTEFVDKVDVDQTFKKYLPHTLIQNCSILDFSYDESEYPKIKGKKFQVLSVADDPRQIPFLAINATTDLRKTVVYVRRIASTEEATYEELQEVINRRLETGHSTEGLLTLLDHMEHLKTLYSLLKKDYLTLENMMNLPDLMGFVRKANEKYPQEDYDDFIVRMIVEKKKIIERHLGVQPK